MNLTPDHILQTGLAFWGSKALLTAVEVELFTDLAKHPGDLASVQGRMGLHPRGARDFLDALVALGFLKRENGIYSNTPEADLFLDKAKPSYIGGILEMANHRLFRYRANSPPPCAPANRKTSRKAVTIPSRRSTLIRRSFANSSARCPA